MAVKVGIEPSEILFRVYIQIVNANSKNSECKDQGAIGNHDSWQEQENLIKEWGMDKPVLGK